MPKHILIVDDDTFLTSMYRMSLENEGFSVTVANDGEQAIAIMDKAQPDLMLLDLLMPKVDGFGVLAHLREKKYSFPAIILSNINEDIDRDKCIRLGAKDFLSKSKTELNELAVKVKKLI